MTTKTLSKPQVATITITQELKDVLDSLQSQFPSGDYSDILMSSVYLETLKPKPVKKTKEEIAQWVASLPELKLSKKDMDKLEKRIVESRKSAKLIFSNSNELLTYLHN